MEILRAVKQFQEQERMERESRILVEEEEIERERKIKQEREEMEKEMVTRERCLNKEKKGREWETFRKVVCVICGSDQKQE